MTIPLAAITAKLRNADFYRQAVSNNISCSNAGTTLNSGIFMDLIKQLCRHVTVDSLTGLYNRQFFQLKLEESLQKAKHEPTEIVLFVIDINDFTAINDSFGYDIADQVLIMLAQRLRGNQGENHILSRIGGDQFTILATDMDQPEAEKIARTIINISSMEMLIADANVNISVSVGMTAIYQRTNNTDSVLQQANHALLQAKQDEHTHIFWQSSETTEDENIS